MLRRCSLTLSLLLLSGFAAAQTRALAVASVEARLFLSNTGQLSEPVLPNTLLWNTIVGDEPSTSTLVKVLVTAAPGSYNKTGAVSLSVAAENSRASAVVFRKRLGVFSPEGRQFVAFWLPETGCQTLRLVATVTGSATGITQVLPFRCGE